jgi:hypothetical protein
VPQEQIGELGELGDPLADRPVQTRLPKSATGGGMPPRLGEVR